MAAAARSARAALLLDHSVEVRARVAALWLAFGGSGQRGPREKESEPSRGGSSHDRIYRAVRQINAKYGNRPS